MRQIFLDTETTGLYAEQGDRVVEIGCVELVNRKLTGNNLHIYLNPGRDSHEEALKVHGLTTEFLRDKPKFETVAEEFLAYVQDAEIIIHNAPFDVAFLDAELARLGPGVGRITDLCRVLDTLALARQMHPGQRNSLDALCKRYSVDNSHREYHGALLDARILAEVYLAMTGGQAKFTLTEESDTARSRARAAAPARFTSGVRIVVVRADEDELAEHEQALARLDKASRGQTVWRRL